jgi:VanZ family protein
MLTMVKRNFFSIFVALIILYLSLANSQTFDKVPLIKIPHLDKVVHFLMYFSLMSVIIMENRNYLKRTGSLLLLAAIPLLYGILMEILQLLTSTRSGNIYDAFADGAGIVFSLLLWLLLKPLFNKKSNSYKL